MFECLRCLNPCRSKRNTEAKLSKRVLKSDENVKILLECEKNGKELVAKAQERRKYRKLDAKQAATKETDKLRKEREVKFKDVCSKNDEELAKIKDEVAKDIEQKIAKINKQAKENREKVLKLLMSHVVDIKPQVHPNLKLLRKIQNPVESTQSTSKTTDSTQSVR